MAADLSCGAPASDWGSGLPADVMGKIGSLLEHDGERTFADDYTDSYRAAVASKRMVSAHWARTIPLGVTALYVNGKAPDCSMITLDSVTAIYWNTTDAPAYLSMDLCDVTPRGDPDALEDLEGSVFASALSKLESLTLVLPAGDVSITGLVDVLAAHGTLTSLTVKGHFGGVDAVLRDVARLTSLEHLEVNAVRETFSDAGLAALSSLTGLTYLSLTGGERVTDACLGGLTSRLTGMQLFSLRRFKKITDRSLDGLAALAEAGTLIWMSVAESPLITPGGWSALVARLAPLMSGPESLIASWSPR